MAGKKEKEPGKISTAVASEIPTVRLSPLSKEKREYLVSLREDAHKLVEDDTPIRYPRRREE